MILTKDVWTKKDYDDFLNYLYKNSDEKYKEFNKKIIKDETLIGVRTPQLKKIAKEIFKGNYPQFLELSTAKTYEEKLIYGLIVGNLTKFDDLTTFFVDNYVDNVDNWALCDLFCSNLKFIHKDMHKSLNYIKKNIKSNNVWRRRVCFVLLIDYFIYEKYLPIIFELCDTYNTSDYYVEMSVAWLISICYIKYKKETLLYLNDNKLNDFTYNKAIQKIIDSTRIEKEEKEILKQMKRRKS